MNYKLNYIGDGKCALNNQEIKMKVFQAESRLQQMNDDYHFLTQSNAQIVFNRTDGLFVFGPRGLKSEIGIDYRSQNKPDVHYRAADGYYNLKSTAQISPKRFAIDRLILLCYYYGKHDETTGDYIITGINYKSKN